jgi:hypothetical protein
MMIKETATTSKMKMKTADDDEKWDEEFDGSNQEDAGCEDERGYDNLKIRDEE